MSKKYVIYCRKSTDESSGKQTQSIPDQIQACLKYAKDKELDIMLKPDDFSQFESLSEIEKENEEVDIDNRRVYLDTRNLFIVKEQKSAKVPKERIKWNKLIKMIDKGEIEGLLSYSPDRQARNLVE
jgi:DNA invertase Pin-like site-specific DNA recombinase